MWFVFFTISNSTHSPVAIHLEGHAVPSVTRTMELKGAHNSSCFTAKPPPPPKILQRPPPPQRGALAWTSGAKAGPPWSGSCQSQAPRKSPTREHGTLQGTFQDLQPGLCTELWSPRSVTYVPRLLLPPGLRKPCHKLHQGWANSIKSWRVNTSGLAGHTALLQLLRAAPATQTQPQTTCTQTGPAGLQESSTYKSRQRAGLRPQGSVPTPPLDPGFLKDRERLSCHFSKGSGLGTVPGIQRGKEGRRKGGREDEEKERK